MTIPAQRFLDLSGCSDHFSSVLVSTHTWLELVSTHTWLEVRPLVGQ
jgi:hypothetical protein